MLDLMLEAYFLLVSSASELESIQVPPRIHIEIHISISDRAYVSHRVFQPHVSSSYMKL
jgi:hypothetical protein